MLECCGDVKFQFCDRAGFEAGEGWNGKGRDRLLCGDGDCSLGYKELCQRLQGVI